MSIRSDHKRQKTFKVCVMDTVLCRYGRYMYVMTIYRLMYNDTGKITKNTNILEDFENASLYIGYHLLKNFLKVKRMYKIIIVSCTSTP